jgi:hypothetical protein
VQRKPDYLINIFKPRLNCGVFSFYWFNKKISNHYSPLAGSLICDLKCNKANAVRGISSNKKKEIEECVIRKIIIVIAKTYTG